MTLEYELQGYEPFVESAQFYLSSVAYLPPPLEEHYCHIIEQGRVWIGDPEKCREPNLATLIKKNQQLGVAPQPEPVRFASDFFRTYIRNEIANNAHLPAQYERPTRDHVSPLKPLNEAELKGLALARRLFDVGEIIALYFLRISNQEPQTGHVVDNILASLTPEKTKTYHAA